MMYKEMQAGIVKSDKLKRASLFLNDMFTTALGSPVPHPSESPPTSTDCVSNHSVLPQVCRPESKDSMVKPVSASNLSYRVHLRRHTTTSLLDDDEDVPHFSQILAPDTIRTSPPLQPVPVAAMVAKASSTESRIDDDDEEWNW